MKPELDRTQDYYGLLGLDRKASSAEIRSAFRNQALKYHPDRNPDAEAQRVFRQISEAYDVLSDPEHRKIYDQIGSEGLRSRTVRDYQGSDHAAIYRQMFGWNPEDPRYFGGESPFGNASPAGFGGRGANLKTGIKITTAEATYGTRKKIEVVREETCSRCGGSRGKPGSWPATCARCKGKGRIDSSPGLLSHLVRCPDCSGSGKRVIIACDACRGAGTTRVNRRVDVRIPAKTKDGDQIRLQGQGDASWLGSPSGDLTVEIHVGKGGGS